MAKTSTLAEALAAQKLGDFEGKDERRAGVEIPSVAGGLRKAMKIQPRRMAQGERGYIAFEYIVEKIKHSPIDPDQPAGDQERIHVLGVEGVTFIDDDLVKEAIAAQKEALAAAEREASGHVNLDDALAEAEDNPQAGDKSGDKPKRGRGRRKGPDETPTDPDLSVFNGDENSE